MTQGAAQTANRPERRAAWETGTAIDSYTPLYRLLLERGIRPHEADMLDLTTVAVLLGVTPEPEPGRAHVPSWWRGDSDAASSSVEAARQLGFVVGEVGT